MVYQYHFDLPCYETSFWLDKRGDYWYISLRHRYNRVTAHIGNYFPARCEAFDIARALNQTEAWHVSEYLTDEYDDDIRSFEEWKEIADKQIMKEEYEDRHLTRMP